MRGLLALSALALASASFAGGIGDPAPPLKVEAVLKGSAPALDKGVHVVGFFDPRYPPSLAPLPKVMELAKKYRGKVDFTEVAIGPNGDEGLAAVKKFVASAPKSELSFAYDGAAGAMAKGWLQANGLNPPATFLVKDGKVLWIGHPLQGLDEALEGTAKGTFDLAASKADFDKRMAEGAAESRRVAALAKAMVPFQEAMRDGDTDGALAELDKVEAAATEPESKRELSRLHFQLLLASGKPLGTLSKRYLETFKADPEALNSLAWLIVDPDQKWPNPDLASALALGEAAAKASAMKDGHVLDTYALALFKNGERAKAIEMQTKAVDLIKKDKDADPDTVKELQDRLAQFKKSQA